MLDRQPKAVINTMIEVLNSEGEETAGDDSGPGGDASDWGQ